MQLVTHRRYGKLALLYGCRRRRRSQTTQTETYTLCMYNTQTRQQGVVGVGLVVGGSFGGETLFAAFSHSDAKPFLIHISDDVVVVVVVAVVVVCVLASRRRAYEHNREKYGSASNRARNARNSRGEKYLRIYSHTKRQATTTNLYSQASTNTLHSNRRLSLTDVNICSQKRTLTH